MKHGLPWGCGPPWLALPWHGKSLPSPWPCGRKERTSIRDSGVGKQLEAFLRAEALPSLAIALRWWSVGSGKGPIATATTPKAGREVSLFFRSR